MTNLNALTKINDFCLFVPDMEAAIDFYTNKMNFKIKSQRQNFYATFEFQGTSLTVWLEDEIIEYAIKKEHLGGDGHHFMIAIKVTNIEDVDEIFEELSSKGVECISPPKNYHWNCRATYFKDIFGNIWEVFAFTK